MTKKPYAFFLLGLIPILILSYIFGLSDLVEMARQCRVMSSKGLLKEYETLFALELLIFILQAAHFASCLGLFFKNKLSRTLFISTSRLLIIQQVAAAIVLGGFIFGFIEMRQLLNDSLVYRGIAHTLYFSLCLAFIYSHSIRVLFSPINLKADIPSSG